MRMVISIPFFVVAHYLGITTAKTDAKGTVFIETAAELESYSVTEEQAMEQKIKDIADAGVNLLISGGTIHEMVFFLLPLRF